MQNWASFVVPALAILIAPGPTNTLLATAGGECGLRKAPCYLAAQALGYAFAIFVARLALGVAPASQATTIALHVGVAAYLLLLATRLWRADPNAAQAVEQVAPRDILITTSLNPKALIFAYGVLPFGSEELPLCFALFFVLTAASGLFWFAVGRRVAQAAPVVFFRGCAALLSAFAVAVCASPFL